MAIIGAIATYVYNNRQARAQQLQADREVAVQRVQTVATFMPYLRSAESREKEAALLAISALGDPQLAANLSSTSRDKASFGALARMAEGSDATAARAAQQSLDAIHTMLRASVVKVIVAVENGGKHRQGSGFAINGDSILTADYVVDAAKGVEIETSDGRHLPCNVLAVQPEHGFAVLRLDEPALRPLPLSKTAPANTPEEGELSCLRSQSHPLLSVAAAGLRVRVVSLRIRCSGTLSCSGLLCRSSRARRVRPSSIVKERWSPSPTGWARGLDAREKPPFSRSGPSRRDCDRWGSHSSSRRSTGESTVESAAERHPQARAVHQLLFPCVGGVAV